MACRCWVPSAPLNALRRCVTPSSPLRALDVRLKSPSAQGSRPSASRTACSSASLVSAMLCVLIWSCLMGDRVHKHAIAATVMR